METVSVNISKTLYQGLKCANVDMNTYPTVDAMVEKQLRTSWFILLTSTKQK